MKKLTIALFLLATLIKNVLNLRQNILSTGGWTKVDLESTEISIVKSLDSLNKNYLLGKFGSTKNTKIIPFALLKQCVNGENFKFLVAIKNVTTKKIIYYSAVIYIGPAGADIKTLEPKLSSVQTITTSKTTPSDVNKISLKTSVNDYLQKNSYIPKTVSSILYSPNVILKDIFIVYNVNVMKDNQSKLISVLVYKHDQSYFVEKIISN